MSLLFNHGIPSQYDIRCRNLLVDSTFTLPLGAVNGYILYTNGAGLAHWGVAPSPGAPIVFGSFYGMTAGTGNPGATDYAATLASSAAPPSVAAGSAMNFPRPSCTAVGGIAINDPGSDQAHNTEFILPNLGTYRVRWQASFDEKGQTSLFINPTPTTGGGGSFNQVVDASGHALGNTGRAALTAQMINEVIFDNSLATGGAAGAVIQVRAYANAAALTYTPIPGGTCAQVVSISIEQLA
jgi:hypothetical protein